MEPASYIKDDKPELFRMFLTPTVKLQRDLGIQTDTEVVVHDAFLRSVKSAAGCHEQT